VRSQNKQSTEQRQAISQGMQAYHARVKEAMAQYLRLKESVRLKRSTRVKKSPGFMGTCGAAAMCLAVLSVVVAAMLIAAREPSPADSAALEAQPEGPAEASAQRASASSTPSGGAVPATRLAADMTAANAPAESAAKRASTFRTPSTGAAPATRLAADLTPVNAPHESAADSPQQTPAALTVTGCLERRDEAFRLKDTTGLDAPTSRSWKSGFLKKRSPSVEVVDAANRLKLTDHVGQRVSVTGVLVNLEIQVRSLQRVAASCN
jgi:hypothetical protein